MGRGRNRVRGVAMALALLWAAPATAQEYLSGHEDLPLLAGLHQDPDSVTVFDAPQGRIVETFAQTQQSAEAVFSAYAATLPQMGWTRETRARYVRGAETLVLEVVGKGSPTVVRILLTSD